MSFGIGLGDVLQLTSMIIGTIKDIHSAPEELRDLAARVASVESTLELLSELASAGRLANGPSKNDP